MTTQPFSGPGRELAGRLRELRESRFSGVAITQRALGRALGGNKPLSAPLISSWEKGVATPTKRWITGYATLFATDRSVDGGALRLLREDELDSQERAERDRLQRELLSLRADALRVKPGGATADVGAALGGTWHFRDGNPIRIVSAEIPEEQQRLNATPTHPSLAYGHIYAFSSIDALFELHGHIRAANPRSDVRVRKDSEMTEDDFTQHLVILGGVDWNPLAARIPELMPHVPVNQVSDGEDPRHAYFEVSSDEETERYMAEVSADGELIADVGLFVRAPNPLNRKRTLTICNAMYSVGTWGVVRALTDERFRDRNAEYLTERFSGEDAFSVLMRVVVLNGHEAMTPDWTLPANRLFEWPERTPSR